MASTFADFPVKIITKIIGYLPVKTRQHCRLVSSTWNAFINEKFPLELEITNENVFQMLRCGNAHKVILRDLTAEIHKDIGFSKSLRHLQTAGKVVTSNLSTFLIRCKNIEILEFSTVRDIMSIESGELIPLPKVVDLRIKIRGDHQVFTLVEMILIDWIAKRIIFSQLTIVRVTVCTPAEYWGDKYRNTEDSSEGFSDDDTSTSTVYNNLSVRGAVSSEVESGNILHSIPAERNIRTIVIEGGSIAQIIYDDEEASSGDDDDPPTGDPSSAIGSRLDDNDVIAASSLNTLEATVSHISGAHAVSAVEEGRSERRVDSIVAFPRESLIFRTMQRLQRTNPPDSIDDLDDVSETNSRMGGDSRLEYYNFRSARQNSNPAAVNNAVFIQLLLKNCKTIKQLIVTTRSDFLCFGNLGVFAEDCKKLQLENLECNFGRSILYMECFLLKAQTKLTRLRMQFVEDMLPVFMMVVASCKNTLTEIDIKIFFINEEREPFSYAIFSQCNNLTTLKSLHFTRKCSLDAMPISLERLLLNGPLSIADLTAVATRLINLSDFSLVLNMNMGSIDVALFKTFLRLPKLRTLTFVQCELDIDGIEAVCKAIPGIKFSIDGSRSLTDSPDIQYVLIVISENMQRQLIS